MWLKAAFPSRWWLILTLLLTLKVKVVSLSKTARSGRGLDPSGWTIWIATVRSKPWTSASSRVGETLTVTTVKMWGYSAYRPVWRLPQQTLPRLRPPSLYDPSTARQVTYLLSKKFSVCFEYPLLRNKWVSNWLLNQYVNYCFIIKLTTSQQVS